LRYIGEPKLYDDIVKSSHEMDGLSLVSKRRDQILEDFCVFASVSDENVLKLISLNVMRHAAKSLTSS
jgi:hypothetical protein